MVIRFLGGLVAGLVLLLTGFVGAMMVHTHAHTGRWEVPTFDDVVEVLQRPAQVVAREGPARIIYLHREGLTVTPGIDNSVTGRSHVLADIAGQDAAPREVARFSGSRARWKTIKRCVERRLAPYDVVVTDRRPMPTDNYILVAVGGQATDLGMNPEQSRGTAGLAPLRVGQAVPRAIVFAFAQTVKNKARAVCETIAHEVGHAYGLEHVNSCKDLMGYRHNCGRQRFVDAPKKCGERGARRCKTGLTTQNSHAYLSELLGLRDSRLTAAPSHEH